MRHIFLFVLVTLSFLLSGQNVGVGTATPEAKMHIKGSNQPVITLTENFNDGLVNQAFLSGDRNWSASTDTPYEGIFSAKAPNLLAGQSANISFPISVPAGKIVNFEYAFRCESSNSEVSFDLVLPNDVLDLTNRSNWISTNNLFFSDNTEVTFKLTALVNIADPQIYIDAIEMSYLADPVFRIEDGTEMMGGILESDAEGNTRWVDLRSEIANDIAASYQNLSYNDSDKLVELSEGGAVRIQEMSSSSSEYAGVVDDTLLTSAGMNFRIPSVDATASELLYDAGRGSLSFGLEPNIDFYRDAPNSFSYGNQNKVYAEYGTVFGDNNLITFSGRYGTLWGKENRLEAEYGTGWGLNNLISANYGTAWGNNNTITGEYNTIWGSGNVTAGMFSTAAGLESESSGDYSFALGEGLVSSAEGQFSVGRFNELNSNSDHLFVVGSGTNASNRLNSITVLRNGNVGIGNGAYNPIDPFTIQGNYEGTLKTSIINLDGEVFHELKCSSLESSFIAFAENGPSERGFIRYDATGDALQLYTIGFDAGSSPVLNIEGGGIGIEELDPDYDLHLGRNSAAKPASSSWIVASDRRLKKDIRTFSDGLSVVKKINPVWFTYNGRANLSHETGVGTIAQELERVAPYMVSEWERDGETYKTVDYGAMDFILINAVKEQQEQIEKYEERIAKLEGLVQQLVKKEGGETTRE